MKEYQILLFYKYVNIQELEIEQNKQIELCKKFKLNSRIILAKEGINGTLEGEKAMTEKYIREMVRDPKYSDIHWKRSESKGKSFPKISVKIRPEIVSLRLGKNDLNPNVVSGKYITAEELHQLYESEEEFYIIDMRNDYEQKVGHFENAILMPIANFRELPKNLEAISNIKHKKVITTCTGGIRCEKASGLLIKNGFTNVYQLYGGMHTYIEKYPNKYFKGSLYVFDGRIVMETDKNIEEHDTISICEICGKSSENYTDCAYLHCSGRRHFICCEQCMDENQRAFCQEECRKKAYQENKFIINR